jgi:hypothetical protein
VSDGGSERLWDPLPGETPGAYAKFRRYLDQGTDRTIVRAAQQLGISAGTLYDLSAKHRWRERALAWDAEMARRQDEALAADRQEMRQRQLRRAKDADAVGRALTHMGVRPDEHAERLPVDPVDCLKFGERFSRFASELEDRFLAGEESEDSSDDIFGELFGLDDPGLRHIAEGSEEGQPR